MIKAAALYERGGTGSGVTVAVIDSGINPDHPEFSERLAGSGYNYIDDVAGVVDDKLNYGHGHGTQMAGLIVASKNNQGMHGVAYDAKVLPMQFGARCKGKENKCDQKYEMYEFDTQIARAWKDSFAQGAQILSNSWSNDLDPLFLNESNYNVLMSDSLATAKDLVAKNVVFVFPTGNEVRRQPQMESGLPYVVKELEKGWLAVTTIKNDGSDMTRRANACGIAAAWCITAPGGEDGRGHGLLTTDEKGGYAEATATSAALKSRFPQMTMQQLRDRLLKTANKTGIYANSWLYGQGLLDLDAASQ